MLSSDEQDDLIVYMGNGRCNLPTGTENVFFPTDGFEETANGVFQSYGSTIAFDIGALSYEFERDALIFDEWEGRLSWSDLWERLPDHFHFARLSGHQRLIVQCSYDLPSAQSIAELS